MKTLLIIYHSQSGTTRSMAQAIADAAMAEKLVKVIVRRAMEADAEDLLAADAVVFGSPENLGYLSGGLKDFFDRTFYAMPEQGLPIAFAAFISAGNDGTGAERQLLRILKGYRMKQVAEVLIERGELSEAGLQRCRELGASLALGLQMGIF
jgi:multimeric flavodoxin WrbA